MRSLLGVFLIVVGVFHHQVAANTCVLEDAEKVDCAPDPGVTPAICLSRGCCWQQSHTNQNVPWCYHAGSQSPPGYELLPESTTSTEHGFHATLQLRSTGLSALGPDIQRLRLDVVYLTTEVVQVKLTDADQARWEVPESVLSRPAATATATTGNAYAVRYTTAPFSLTVSRVSDNVSVFVLDSELIFKDQYLELNVPTDPLAKTFGIGESTRLEQALQVPSLHTLWAADIAAQQFYTNLYGSYPYYVQLLNGKAHGVMLLNSNGMDVSVLQDKIRFQVIGGVLDLYVFTGSSPEQVVQQYTDVVGKPALQPYWSLGFHNCRWGYESVHEIEQVVRNYSLAGLPLETQWADIDYMQDYRDFTLDSVDFSPKAMRRFVDGLHAKGQKFVPIVDPGIEPFPGYDAYEEGLQQELFIRDMTGQFYLGQVWPGPTNFPDFLNPKIQVRDFADLTCLFVFASDLLLFRCFNHSHIGQIKSRNFTSCCQSMVCGLT
jgi:alpha-glucosidase (family GH31 glycosyl hydrolase)